MEQLKCYASGDGALHFSYVENDKATGRKVTLEDAENYLKNDPDSSVLRAAGWRAIILDSQPVLVAKIFRVNENTLNLDGQEFRYNIRENSLWTDSGHCTDYFLDIECVVDDAIIPVNNYSMRACLRHFINNEAKLPKPKQIKMDVVF
jgi:hypothetical protein